MTDSTEIYSKKSLTIRAVPGRKSPDDKAIEIKTDGWHRITFKELCYIRNALLENEDRLFPQPKYKGSKMLMEMEAYAFEFDPELAEEMFITSYRQRKCY